MPLNKEDKQKLNSSLLTEQQPACALKEAGVSQQKYYDIMWFKYFSTMQKVIL